VLGIGAFTDWLTRVSGALVFVATAVLAGVAMLQMRKLNEQAEAEAAAVQKQIDASIAQGEAIREAARAQLQPMVFAHADRVQTHADTTTPDQFGQQHNEIC